VDLDYTKAMFLLENRLQELYFSDGAHSAPTDVECPSPFSRFRCKMRAAPVANQLPRGLSEVHLAVAWPAGAHARNISVTTFLSERGADAPSMVTP
jgi:hypothetical protein